MLTDMAPDGGPIAGSGVRAVMESAGVQDVLTKIVGSRNPFNVVRATFDAITSLMTEQQVRALRGIDMPSNDEESAPPTVAETETAEATEKPAEEEEQS